MKFLTSLLCSVILSILLMLTLGLVLKCDHNNIIEVYSFEPEKSTAMNSIKTVCEECGQSFSLSRGYGVPSDKKYLIFVGEHCVDKTFTNGEYDTIKATVTVIDYFTPITEIRCSVCQDGVKVYFSVDFKEECEEAVSLLQVGDEITFRGKSALKGLSWTDCELITGLGIEVQT